MTLLAKPFVFARHAQSEFNAAFRIGGFTDSPLSAMGIQQAKEAAQILSAIDWSVVVTSTLKRTQETAFYALPKQTALPYEQLKERNWGDLEGCPIEQQLPYDVTPPNGESWQDFEARVLSALNEILSEYSWPLIIAHSGVYRVLNNVINGTPYCPRVGNVTPISFVPSEDENSWEVTSFKGSFI
ncbi:histidine phosphatase family protein [Marinomonas foliarum]|uniref:phosphoglycerate mutase (2,3-diphosphoglycerate-dependent) n=1 Tax=Marinomonas foliarum TaxID=491950 RepID=A0A369AGJ5_9GAMM|nr:histidine phosphatase family protein [Marinomonas foliarum]RCX08469.1 putative phosphoglycerate mutase [Marinomonas foliarum]